MELRSIPRRSSDVPVRSIEYVLLSATERRENVALAFEYHDAAQLAAWEALALPGLTLELEEGGVTPSA